MEDAGEDDEEAAVGGAGSLLDEAAFHVDEGFAFGEAGEFEYRAVEGFGPWGDGEFDARGGRDDLVGAEDLVVPVVVGVAGGVAVESAHFGGDGDEAGMGMVVGGGGIRGGDESAIEDLAAIGIEGAGFLISIGREACAKLVGFLEVPAVSGGFGGLECYSWRGRLVDGELEAAFSDDPGGVDEGLGVVEHDDIVAEERLSERGREGEAEETDGGGLAVGGSGDVEENGCPLVGGKLGGDGGERLAIDFVGGGESLWAGGEEVSAGEGPSAGECAAAEEGREADGHAR